MSFKGFVIFIYKIVCFGVFYSLGFGFRIGFGIMELEFVFGGGGYFGEGIEGVVYSVGWLAGWLG